MTGSGGGAQGHSHVSATGAEYGCQSGLTAGLPESVLESAYLRGTGSQEAHQRN